MNNTDTSIHADIATITRLSIVPAILEMICRTTGMGFSAVARVTDQRWVACSVRDEINFGLMPLGELKLDTTICHEIRQSGDGVVIDHVAEDEYYHNHHTPLLYGFQSYISIPLKLQDGSFFGTLCAIDPHPAVLNTPEMISMFKTFASLIAFHLHAAMHFPETTLAQMDERTIAELNNQLIKITGHGLGFLVTTIHSEDQRNVMRSEEFARKIRQSSSSIAALLYELKALAG